MKSYKEYIVENKSPNIKELQSLISYYNHYGFFPVNNEIVNSIEDELDNEENYDEKQNKIYRSILNRISTLAINDNEPIIVYHGDNYNTKKLDPILMNNGNAQEGIGIYFTTKLKTAEFYGKDVVSAKILHKKFVDSRKKIKTINNKKIIGLLKSLWKLDKEQMYYLITDYGVEVKNIEDITSNDIGLLYENMKQEEIRNFQIELANSFGVELFVEQWNKYVKIDGTYQKQGENEVWYAIINTNIKLEPVK